MHGVIVIPFTSPNESVLLENRNDFCRHAIAVLWIFTVVEFPTPVVSSFSTQIDCDTVTVGTFSPGSGYGPM